MSSSSSRRVRRRLLPAIALLTAAGPLAGQSQGQVLDLRSATEVRAQYLADLDSLHVKILALAEVIPESKYAWSPTPETRTIANALMHVATEWYVWVPMSVAGKPPADFGAPRERIPQLEKVTAKAEVLEHLRKAWAHARQAVESVDLNPLLGSRQFGPNAISFTKFAFGMTADLHEHLGQLVTYTRSIGEVPPWSKKSGS